MAKANTPAGDALRGILASKRSIAEAQEQLASDTEAFMRKYGKKGAKRVKSEDGSELTVEILTHEPLNIDGTIVKPRSRVAKDGTVTFLVVTGDDVSKIAAG